MTSSNALSSCAICKGEGFQNFGQGQYNNIQTNASLLSASRISSRRIMINLRRPPLHEDSLQNKIRCRSFRAFRVLSPFLYMYRYEKISLSFLFLIQYREKLPVPWSRCVPPPSFQALTHTFRTNSTTRPQSFVRPSFSPSPGDRTHARTYGCHFDRRQAATALASSPPPPPSPVTRLRRRRRHRRKRPFFPPLAPKASVGGGERKR